MLILEIEPTSRHSPEHEIIARVDWDAFLSLTFQRKPLGFWPAVRTFFKYLRTVGPQLSVNWHNVEFAGRYEHGEKTGRPHLHALVRGVPLSTSAIFILKNAWEGEFVRYEKKDEEAVYKTGYFRPSDTGLGCGSARVRRYEDSRDEATEYFTKKAAASYEAQKVRVADKLFLSRAFTKRLNALLRLETKLLHRSCAEQTENQAIAV